MSYRGQILLVDDKPATSYMITMILKLNDFDVAAYSEPELALSNFDKGLYDLILMDVELPGTNGFELFKKMREIDDKVKICFMTDRPATHINKFKTSFPDLPSTSLAEKPVTSEDLLKVVGLSLADPK